jgi:hypothetical protein
MAWGLAHRGALRAVKRYRRPIQPPTGRSCPAWIGVSVASRPPSPPGRLATPSVDDLVRLALQRAYQRALDGEAEVTLRDAAALLRLQREIDREAARQAAGTIALWEATLQEVLWVARGHLGEHWKPFVADIRTNQHPAAMWGLSGKSGRARQVPRPRAEHHASNSVVAPAGELITERKNAYSNWSTFPVWVRQQHKCRPPAGSPQEPSSRSADPACMTMHDRQAPKTHGSAANGTPGQADVAVSRPLCCIDKHLGQGPTAISSRPVTLARPKACPGTTSIDSITLSDEEG